MKKVIALFAVVIMIAGLSSSVFAQNVSNTTSGARIVQPISITKDLADLSFGTIVRNATGGDVVLATNATRTYTGGLVGLTVSPAAATPTYTVTGQQAATYAITLPAPFNVTSPGGAAMQVNTFVSSIGTTGTLSGVLNGVGDGTQTFRLGATLNVGANQGGGYYTGTFDVTVAYN